MIIKLFAFNACGISKVEMASFFKKDISPLGG